MDIKQLKLAGAKLISPDIFRDNRGFFIQIYQKDYYHSLGIGDVFVQDNGSYSKKGVIRGMHFQSDPGQAKLVQVACGKIFDVIVDIRPHSPTFAHWEGVYLDDALHRQLYIPMGFAHGFCVVSSQAYVLYKTSAPYVPEAERGFRFDDPDIGIDWPLEKVVLSERDRNSPLFSELRWP